MAPPKLKHKTSSNGTPKERTPDHPLARCKPRGDRVVIRRDKKVEETRGGILLPDSYDKTRKNSGTVWSVGPGLLNKDGDRIPLDLVKGQRVLITGYAGLEITDPGSIGSEDEEFIILRDEDIIAVFDPV